MFWFSIYKATTMTIGTIVLFIMIIAGIRQIYVSIAMKRIAKKYAKKLNEINIFNDVNGKMTDEEKEKLEKDGKAETKITLDFKTMEYTKETK